MREIIYNRYAAAEYAKKWALSRNDEYYNFDSIGGDCTNFASQCIYAGAKIMNFTPDTGWYYRSVNDRSAAWTGVEYLYKFLVNNKGAGPFAHTVAENEIRTGDIIQLGRNDGSFYHSLVVTQTAPHIRISAHTYDSLNRRLDSYVYETIRYIHIDGVRAW
ncbi:MAG: amidase domain-containing protein [Clostridia bacterium]|nr:amidase domain-containing protein [Clostridia bacterium]